MKVSQVNDRFEKVLLDMGYDSVIGVDEVGRGSWAGPVVAAAFVYKRISKVIPLVNDSKRLTLKRRLQLDKELQVQEFSIASAGVDEIDKINILEATRLAMHRAVSGLNLKRSFVLVDGYFKEPFDFKYKCIAKGDGKHYSIAAASVLAKVYRDNLMIKLAKRYPNYGFETNVGYGTAEHRTALGRYGVCHIHRRSYKPIKSILDNN